MKANDQIVAEFFLGKMQISDWGPATTMLDSYNYVANQRRLLSANDKYTQALIEARLEFVDLVKPLLEVHIKELETGKASEEVQQNAARLSSALTARRRGRPRRSVSEVSQSSLAEYVEWERASCEHQKAGNAAFRKRLGPATLRIATKPPGCNGIKPPPDSWMMCSPP